MDTDTKTYTFDARSDGTVYVDGELVGKIERQPDWDNWEYVAEHSAIGWYNGSDLIITMSTRSDMVALLRHVYAY